MLYELKTKGAMTLTIDHRERHLMRALETTPYKVKALPVGDVLCEYEDGSSWIAERKRAEDLSASIQNGRWGDQLTRLYGTCYHRIFFLVEGDLRATSLPHDSLLGACVNAELRSKSHLIRTTDVAESAAVVRHLIEKARGIPGLPPGLCPPPMSKRKRDSDRETCFLRQLMCIPSISEKIARKLLEEFGTLPALQRAAADIGNFPKVRLDERTCLGKARVEKLALYLGEA